MSGTSREQTVLPINESFARLAADGAVERAASQLRVRGHTVIVADNKEAAAKAVRELIPEGAEVFDATSRTLDDLGISAEMRTPGRYDPLRVRAGKLDRQKDAREMRKLLAAPDYVVGSVHAVTEEGDLVIASASGSQLGAYAYAGGRVIWVVGTQKIVPDLGTALRRVREYSYPLEDARARKVYGVGSGVNKVLIVHQETVPGRTTVVIVKENLGF